MTDNQTDACQAALELFANETNYPFLPEPTEGLESVGNQTAFFLKHLVFNTVILLCSVVLDHLHSLLRHSVLLALPISKTKLYLDQE